MLRSFLFNQLFTGGETNGNKISTEPQQAYKLTQDSEDRKLQCGLTVCLSYK